MPIELLTAILQGILTLSTDAPEIIVLAENAIQILQAGSVTPAQEINIRGQLDTIKDQIDAA